MCSCTPCFHEVGVTVMLISCVPSCASCFPHLYTLQSFRRLKGTNNKKNGSWWLNTYNLNGELKEKWNCCSTVMLCVKVFQTIGKLHILVYTLCNSIYQSFKSMFFRAVSLIRCIMDHKRSLKLHMPTVRKLNLSVCFAGMTLRKWIIWMKILF
jgi:hypothetical protein